MRHGGGAQRRQQEPLGRRELFPALLYGPAAAELCQWYTSPLFCNKHHQRCSVAPFHWPCVSICCRALDFESEAAKEARRKALEAAAAVEAAEDEAAGAEEAEQQTQQQQQQQQEQEQGEQSAEAGAAAELSELEAEQDAAATAVAEISEPEQEQAVAAAAAELSDQEPGQEAAETATSPAFPASGGKRHRQTMLAAAGGSKVGTLLAFHVAASCRRISATLASLLRLSLPPVACWA